MFRRFGASEAIRHDIEICKIHVLCFRAFDKNGEQKQNTTMAYMPQENDITARMAQTLTRALKLYVTDVD